MSACFNTFQSILLSSVSSPCVAGRCLPFGRTSLVRDQSGKTGAKTAVTLARVWKSAVQSAAHASGRISTSKGGPRKPPCLLPATSQVSVKKSIFPRDAVFEDDTEYGLSTPISGRSRKIRYRYGATRKFLKFEESPFGSGYQSEPRMPRYGGSVVFLWGRRCHDNTVFHGDYGLQSTYLI